MADTIAYLGLGSNLGDQLGVLREAVRRLGATPGVNILRLSPVYETDPVSDIPQPQYLNAVAEVGTSLTPQGLLDVALQIETEMGRVRTVRWGPRVIDIDVLLHGDAGIDDPELTVPHPRMRERAFVLIPLADLAPTRIFPGTSQSIRMLSEYLGSDGVKAHGESI